MPAVAQYSHMARLATTAGGHPSWPSMTTLTDLLADDLVAWRNAAADSVPRRVVLWLDPRREFVRLAACLEPAMAARGARLLRLEQGEAQLPLKLDLLRLEGASNEAA